MSSSRPCPLCRSERTRVVASTEAAAVVAGWNREFGIDVSADLSGASRIERLLCLDCALEFHDPPCPGSPALYTCLQAFPWYYMDEKWEYGEAVRDLHPAARVLEIGCGRGAFLARLKREDQNEIHGLETNAAAAAAAAALGFDVRTLSVEEQVALEPGEYDSVCSFQVLEHVPDPRGFLESCLGLLAPGGRLVLAVPDNDAFPGTAGGLLNAPPHHVTRWSEKTMRTVAGIFSLDVRRIKHESLASYHVEEWITAHANRTRRPGAAPSRLRAVRIRILKALLRFEIVRRRCRGHTLYASFRKRG